MHFEEGGGLLSEIGEKILEVWLGEWLLGLGTKEGWVSDDDDDCLLWKEKDH